MTTRHNPHAVVGTWLLGTAGTVVGMIHIGGITRLTKSGLSMTDWSFVGSLPPRSLEQWQDEFARYRTFPEWQQRQSMTLQEFQFIYYWEYGHRMLGRMVGFVFAGPWLYFTLRHKIPPGFQPRMMGLFAMGGTQGLVGWWMVKSGLGDDRRGDRKEIRVQPVRLAAHLSMALATYGALVWTGLDVWTIPHAATVRDKVAQLSQQALRHASVLRRNNLALATLTTLTIVSGALVAGNDAGRAYNTFPTMNGQWVPDTLYSLSPWYRSLTEDTATVQWNHRVLGTTTALTAISLTALGLRRPVTPQVRKGLYAVGIAATGQFTLGVTALLHYVPISLAAAHQLGAIVVFTSSLYLGHSLRFARPMSRVLTRAATSIKA